ncbi:MAG TPA: hypothetical protein VLI07_18740 [Candidatus Binatus sp.]|nr:hypothetical protein [Candidatus Binatus sp.]
MTDLDTEPYFASEAQETFTEGCRVFAPQGYGSFLGAGSEGTYVGRHPRHGAVVRWDTIDGAGMIASIPWERVKNLYR